VLCLTTFAPARTGKVNFYFTCGGTGGGWGYLELISGQTVSCGCSIGLKIIHTSLTYGQLRMLTYIHNIVNK
jgi:hypothetical protein